MYDKEVINRHLAALITDLNKLEKHKNCTAGDFDKNVDLLWIIERGIFLSIQNILDLFAHIIASDLNLKWDSYSEIAEILFRKKIISEDQKDLLIKMTGLRNRLSHDYLELDLEILIDIINNRLDDFYDFVNIIKEHYSLP